MKKIKGGLTPSVVVREQKCVIPVSSEAAEQIWSSTGSGPKKRLQSRRIELIRPFCRDA